MHATTPPTTDLAARRDAIAARRWVARRLAWEEFLRGKTGLAAREDAPAAAAAEAVASRAS